MLTNDDIIEAFAEAGIDTKEKLTGLLVAAGGYVTRQNLAYQLDAAKVQRQKAVAAADDLVSQAEKALQAADAALLPK
jgi:hypothetical protein